MTEFRHKFTAGLLATGMLLSSSPLFFQGEASAAAEDVSGCAQEILEAQCAGASVQGWVDAGLTPQVGMSSPDWYVMALSGHYVVDLTGYRAALLQYLENNTVASASSRERLALALTACGGGIPSVCTDILDSSAGEMGIMSRIFGLHLLNNGVPSSQYTTGELAEELVSLQAPDGGWSLQGGRGDADVTAMTLQALAPYQALAEVAPAVQNGLAYLSAVQLESGAYQSYGTENPESTAQVWLALCCLGIDPLNDSRFIKNDHNLLDGILQFRVSPGQYEHSFGGGANTMATVQVFTALTAQEMLYSGQGSFYLFQGAFPQWQMPAAQTTKVTQGTQSTQSTKNTQNTNHTQNNQTTAASRTTKTTAAAQTQAQRSGTAQARGTAANGQQQSGTTARSGNTKTDQTQADTTKTISATETQPNESAQQTAIAQAQETSAESSAETSSETVRTTAPPVDQRSDSEKYPYRIPMTAGAAVLFGGAAVFFVLRRQKSPKTYLTIAGGFCIVTALIWLIRVESPEQFYQAEGHSGGGQVTMAIRCDVILGLPGSEAYPEDGVIMPTTEFSIAENENALELLYDAVKLDKLQIEVDGISGETVETAYVRGIAHLYEFDFGDLSGWTYTVNGERPSVGCGAFTLHDGDVVVWEYTVNL